MPGTADSQKESGMTPAKKLTEQAFIWKWWKRRFPHANPPTWGSAIMAVDAVDLLTQYRLYLAGKKNRVVT